MTMNLRNLSLAAAKARGVSLHGALTNQPVRYQKGGKVIVGAGAAPAKGTIYVVSGTAGGIAGDVDKVSLDGACPVRLTLYNPGPANVTLTHQAAGQAVVTETVAPSTTAAAAGALTRFDWTYADPTPNRVTTVTITATIQ